MNEQLLAMEHYRLHLVEEWKDGPYKSAVIAAIQSAVKGIAIRENIEDFQCSICQSRKELSHQTEQSIEETFGRAA